MATCTAVAWVTSGIHAATVTNLLRGVLLARTAFITGAGLEKCGGDTIR